MGICRYICFSNKHISHPLYSFHSLKLFRSMFFYTSMKGRMTDTFTNQQLSTATFQVRLFKSYLSHTARINKIVISADIDVLLNCEYFKWSFLLSNIHFFLSRWIYFKKDHFCLKVWRLLFSFAYLMCLSLLGEKTLQSPFPHTRNC